ncbi:MAG: cysteine synthase family protein [Desulfovibrio sp.]|jgi:cysteine synthase B|nr:cysteine synthase family protein [Desulfovibrio sp.]
MRILDVVGDTPLLRLDKIAAEVPGIVLRAKAEFCNPSGSVKDRAAKAMLVDGMQKGLLKKGKIILDATSGNTGVAYAMMGAALGYAVTLYMPANANAERKRMLAAYGANIVYTDPLESSDGAYLAARAAAGAEPELYFYPDQYNNKANALAHYDGTGAEILRQSRVTHFVACMGTSGTFTGVAGRLKAHDRAIRAMAVQPDSPLHGIEGTKHMPSTIRPGILDENLIDGIIAVSTGEACAMTRRLAREEGILVGISSGANVQAALKLARKAPKHSEIVTILCDTGTRYLSDSFWEATA